MKTLASVLTVPKYLHYNDENVSVNSYKSVQNYTNLFYNTVIKPTKIKNMGIVSCLLLLTHRKCMLIFARGTYFFQLGTLKQQRKQNQVERVSFQTNITYKFKKC